MAFLKSIWKANSRHKKLSEELALQSIKDNEDEIEVENDVVTFKLKYLGSTIVEKVLGDNISTEAVKNILKVTKASRKKITRVNVNISLKGVVVTDLQGNDIFKVSIYRISNCSTDSSHRQVFSFISTDTNETTECHAFLCSKRKVAETVTLAVAHAFSCAYEAWRILPSTREFEQKSLLEETIDNAKPIQIENDAKVLSIDKRNVQQNIMDQLINLDASSQIVQNDWVSFEDDFSSLSHQNNYNQVDLILA